MLPLAPVARPVRLASPVATSKAVPLANITALVSAALIAAAWMAPVRAAPTDGVVRAGTATIATNGTTTTITQTSDRAVIDWHSFNIATTERVTFAQPTTQSATLNRVTGTQMSSLQGALSANGQIYLINPNGILIGNGATVDAAAFVATTANIGTDAFMSTPVAASGRYTFDQVTTASSTGSIVNAGTITAADGGLVALVAPAVRNSGTIAARLGKITLASGNIFTLDFFGDDLVRLAVNDKIASSLTDANGARITAQVDVPGQLRADGGRIALLSVPAAAGVVDAAINLSGTVRAQTLVAGKQGEILLVANGGDVNISGSVDATGAAPGLLGGNVRALGTHLHLLSPAHIDASGAGGGGLVAIGGRLTVGDTTTENDTTTVDYGASITACGTLSCADDGTGGSGNGGTVRLYSSNGTKLDGKVDVSSAEGSVAGTVEVLSNLGLTTLGPQSQVFARTGTGLDAGFAVIIGDELSVAPTILMDMRDFAGNANLSATHVLYDNANPPARVYIRGNDPAQTFLQTTDPVVFHAYNPDAQDPANGYVAHLPARDNPNDGFEASGYTTPVGTLRPNGGAPTTPGSVAADALVAIPVSLAPPDVPPPGSSLPGGSPGGSPIPVGPGSQVPGASDPSVNNAFGQAVDTTSRVSRTDTSEDRARSRLTGLSSADGNTSADGSASAASADGRSSSDDTVADSGPLPLIVGGPGVAQIADLGRNGAVSGATPDVFGVNFHVVAPAGGAGDAPVTDYLCKTPFARNACPTPASPAP